MQNCHGMWRKLTFGLTQLSKYIIKWTFIYLSISKVAFNFVYVARFYILSIIKVFENCCYHSKPIPMVKEGRKETLSKFMLCKFCCGPYGTTKSDLFIFYHWLMIMKWVLSYLTLSFLLLLTFVDCTNVQSNKQNENNTTYRPAFSIIAGKLYTLLQEKHDNLYNCTLVVTIKTTFMYHYSITYSWYHLTACEQCTKDICSSIFTKQVRS